MVVADDAQLVEHVAREIGPAVVERRQEAEDLQALVQLEPDRVDDLDEVRQALHRVVLRLDRDDHAVRGDQAVDGQQAEVRRAVDQRVVVALPKPALERVAQELLAAEHREQLALGRGEVDVRRRDVDALGLRRPDDLVDRRAPDEDIGHRHLDRVEVDAQAGGEIRLRIHVDAQDTQSVLGQGAGQVDRRRGLADPALLIGDRDDIRHRGFTSFHRDSGSIRSSRGGGPKGRGAGRAADIDRSAARPFAGLATYPQDDRVVHRTVDSSGVDRQRRTACKSASPIAFTQHGSGGLARA